MLEKGTGSKVQAKGIDDFLRPDHLISDEAKTYCKTLRRFIDNEVLPRVDEFDSYWDWT